MSFPKSKRLSLHLNKLLLITLCSLILSSCTNTTSTNLKTLRLTNRGGDPKTLNPWISSDATSSLMGSLMFDGLVKSNLDTDEVEPHMAESYQIEDSGKTIVVKLRDDLFWSDGHKITSEDVGYTWNHLIKDGVAISSLADVIKVEGEFPEITAIDERTVKFKTKKVFAPFLKLLSIEIAPKHDIERFFKDNKANSLSEKQEAFNRYLSIQDKASSIVSSGAFRFHKIHNGQRIEFTRNPNYFLKDKNGHRYPYLDKLVFVYAQDDSAELFRFLAGEIHAITVSPQNAAFVKSLEKKYKFKVYDLGSSTSTNFIWFNLSSNVPEPKYSWFNNYYFRKAINYAIDRESIISNVFQGLGKPLYTAESLRSPYLNKAISLKQDFDIAAKLLEQGGFKSKIINNQKILFDKNNNRVEFNLITNAGNLERELCGVIIQDNLAKLGIKVNFKLIEFNNFVSKSLQGKDFDSGILSLTGSTEPNGGANVWKSDGRLHLFDVKSSQKNPKLRDWEKEIDNLFDQGVQTMDFNKRKEIYDKFQELVFDQNPLIYIAAPKIIMAISSEVRNIRISHYGTPLDELYKLDLKSKN